MANIALSVIAVFCAFAMGYSINQGSTCAVTAAKEIVNHRRWTMLAGLAMAIGVAGLICLPSAWLFGAGAHIERSPAITGTLLLGAVMLGIGAFINDACLLGTLSRIGHGEVRFLALPVGLAIGFAIADRQSLLVNTSLGANQFTTPSFAGLAIVIAFGVLVFFVSRYLGRMTAHRGPPEWPLSRAMAILGLCGAILFLFAPGWTYADALRRSVEPGGKMIMFGAGALIAAIAALAGALVSGLLARSFRYKRPDFWGVSRSLAGGAVMAFGGTLIPGGNDTLLLASVPSFSLGGVTAFTLMSLTVPLLLIGQNRFMARVRKPQPDLANPI